MRSLRLIIGLVAMVQAIVQKDAVIGVLSAFLLFTALANVGCCGAEGCALDVNKNEKRRRTSNEKLDR